MSFSPFSQLTLTLVVACTFGVSLPAQSKQSPSVGGLASATVNAQEAQAVDPAAMKVLQAMGEHLARARTIRVKASTLHDVVEPTGIKSLIAMDVVGYVRRPNLLHVRFQRDDGASRLVWYDGSTLARFDPHLKTWSSVALEAASVGELADHLIDKYELNLTLADFLYDDPAAAFGQDLLSGVHKGLRYVDGVVCDYLSFESAGADFQLWVTSGARPVPKRFVVTYVGKPGEPQYIANLSWEFDEYLDDGMFQFTAPAGVTKEPLEPKTKPDLQVKMKMTTEIPASVITPDAIDTRLGTLRFVDGFPTADTSRRVWDQLDFQRAVEAMIMTTPAASLVGFRRAIRQFGPDNETMIIWEGRMDSKVLILTPNTTVVYAFMWIDLENGPMVMETPPNVLGLIDDAWFHYVTDFGNAGPDKGKGGKFLLVPPDYKGRIPDGYFVKQSKTYGHWLAMRGFMKDFEAGPVVKNMKDHFRLYPLGSAPKEVSWVNVAGKAFNTLHAQDETFFAEVNETVQKEPSSAHDPEILGLLASIGIEKGKPFAPDDRMKKILAEAATVGTAAQRSILFRNRNENVVIWPGSKSWEVGFAGGSYAFLDDGISLNDERARFHFYATGITPAMVTPPVGAGSQYVIGLRDSEGRALDGSKTYKLHIPPNVPAKRFWDVTVYDNQTRSLVQTDHPFPGVTSIDPGTVRNADGSYDIYFGPQPPGGEQINWIQTIPGKGWNVLWRIYGPLQAWYDKAWRPSEIELVN